MIVRIFTIFPFILPVLHDTSHGGVYSRSTLRRGPPILYFLWRKHILAWAGTQAGVMKELAREPV